VPYAQVATTGINNLAKPTKEIAYDREFHMGALIVCPATFLHGLDLL